jgi:alpha-glucosidase
MAKSNGPKHGLIYRLRYNAAARARTRRFGQKPPRGRFQSLGQVIGVEQTARGLHVQAERGYLAIEFVTPDVVRVRMRQTADFPPPFSYAIANIDWPAVTPRYRSEQASLSVSAGQLICRIERSSCRLTFLTAGGQVVCQDKDGIAWREREVRWTRQLPQQEGCFGLGERAHGLNLRGERLALWNTDPHHYKRGDDPLYASIPFYLGLQPGRACGILWDNPARGYVDLGATRPDEMTFLAEDGELRFYLFVGPNTAEVLKQYTDLTGRMPLPPLWALGFHQSRYSYESEAVFHQVAKEFRERKLPCDVLYFDIDYMDGFRVFTWDRKRFPTLPGLLADLSRQGFKSVAIIDPGIKVDPGYDVYDDGVKQDVFLKYPDGALTTGPVWPGDSHFPDFTSARVRAWWAEQVAPLIYAGFTGFWNDMNEPTIFIHSNNTLPDYVVHDWDGAGRSHLQGGHNVYGMLMARATREGLQKQRPDQRHFVMTRAAYAGAQRYTSAWTGDNMSTWDHLRLSISMVLNMGLSGMAFTGPDVGGFAGTPDGELYTRWMQLGSMLPYFRAHTANGTPAQEPWSYGESYEKIARAALELRYQLLPYIYSTVAQCAQSGIPIARPLFMADPTDDNLRTIDDSFMLGDSLLVAPVLEKGATKRDVYLPRGVWYEYHTGKLIDGAQRVTVDAPLERLPLYVRAGRVIPMWPVMQYVGEKRLDEARLRVYAGSGETTIYEDAGEGLGYQHGDYRWSYFTCKFLPSGQFAIEWRRAGQYQPPYQQVRVEVVGISGEPESVALDGQSAPIWYYEDGIVEYIVKPFAETRVIGRSHTSSEAQQTIPRRPRK